MSAQDELTRRRFLAGAAAVAGSAALGVGCGDDDAGAQPDAALDAGRPAADAAGPPALVGIAHRDDVEQAVRRAIELAGGIDEIGPGKTVFIKPNVVWPGPQPSRPAITTSTAVLQAVVKIVKERSPQRVIVGDRSARGFDSAATFDASGLRAAALAGGADEVYAAPTPAAAPGDWVLLQPPQYQEMWETDGGILAMRKLVEADYLINVPVLKDHRWAVFSLSMKNFIGAIGDSSRGGLHAELGGDPGPLGRGIAILNQMFHPLMSVLDGWDALISGGPDGGVIFPDGAWTTPRLIMASRDRIALDAAGVSLLKLELSRTTLASTDQAHRHLVAAVGPWSLPQIVHGIERGLGVRGPEGARLELDSVADAAEISRIFASR